MCRNDHASFGYVGLIKIYFNINCNWVFWFLNNIATYKNVKFYTWLTLYFYWSVLIKKKLSGGPP